MERNNPNGGVKNGADITGDAQFYTIHTVIAHEAGDNGVADNASRNLIRLSEAIRMRVNMHYIHVSAEELDLSDADVRGALGLGTNFNQADTVVYTVKFAAEQSGCLKVADLVALLQGQATPFVTVDVPAQGGDVDISTYDLENAATKNLSVLVFENL